MALVKIIRLTTVMCSDMRKMSLNLIPFPRMHFLTPSVAPMTTAGSQAYQSLSVPELTAG
jgi:tubulin beta